MIDLGSWMNKMLVKWGVSPNIANAFDETIVAILMVFVAIGINYACKAVFIGVIKYMAKRMSNKWGTLAIKRKLVYRVSNIIPGILMYFLLPLAFVHGKELLFVSQKICLAYIIAICLLALNSFLLIILDWFGEKEQMKNKPMKGLIQVCQVATFFVGGIVIISVLLNKSPMTLFAGLGASAAILMLVFKDTIMGFVAGIQLSANDMLRPGDWITIPESNVNGHILEITLNTVKVQNFDKTILTVPPSDLVNDVFQNWRGMQESGGRRVMKNITLDLDTIRFCTPEMLDGMRRDITLLSDYQPEEGVVPTNSQMYRVYIERYLNSLPIVNQELDLIISQKEATQFGVPIEVYFFSRNKIWKEYERIQSDIFDHLFAMVPKFGLRVYQFTMDYNNMSPPQEGQGK